MSRETSAHLGLSANEEERTGASGSAGEGARFESAESLERTFEGSGRGGITAIGRVSPRHATDSAAFRCLSVRTGGAVLRFSRCVWVIRRILIHDSGRTKPITGFGAGWGQDGDFGSLPFGVLEATGMRWCVCIRGCIRIQKLSLKLCDLALDGLLPGQFLLLSAGCGLHLLT